MLRLRLDGYCAYDTIAIRRRFMLIRRKHWAMSAGYNVATDYPISLMFYFGRRAPAFPGDLCWRRIIGFACDYPRFEWRDSEWAIDEAETLRGFPVRRRGVAAATWTGRRYWLHRVVWNRIGYWVKSE